MTGALRKTMLYLGLADDRGEDVDTYDDYDDGGQDVAEDYPPEVTPLRRATGTREVVRAVEPPSELRRIETVHPRSYNDARVIGEAFRSGIPVIINLTDMADADAKRLVDFSAGLIFGLHGTIERVTNKVFLLSPEHVEVTGEERAAGAEKSRAGFYNQS